MFRRNALLGSTTLLAVLALAACGSSASPQASGIYGIVVISGGPPMISPSPLPDGFGTSLARPEPQALTITVTKAGKVVAKTVSVHSLFRVVLPPGRYGLRYDDYPPVAITVRAGHYARAVLMLTGHTDSTPRARNHATRPTTKWSAHAIRPSVSTGLP
jgi:hypothetical protein